MARPELGDVKVGDELLVTPARESGLIRAQVVKVARVWLDLEEVAGRFSYRRTWRMRRDTQDEGGRNYPQRNDRFRTAAQVEYDRRQEDANAYLRSVGVNLSARIGLESWHSPDRRLILANLMRAHDGLPPI